jgi:PAS domain S-box-containing protein
MTLHLLFETFIQALRYQGPIDRCVLIRNTLSGWTPIAEATAQGLTIADAITESVVVAERLPQRLIDCMGQMPQVVAITNVAVMMANWPDPYWQQTSVAAVLVVPIVCQQELLGLLYFEQFGIATSSANGLHLDVAIIQVLAAQLGVSLHYFLACQAMTQTVETLVATVSSPENKFRRLVENANDVIFTVTVEGRFTYLSPQFEEMFGARPEDFLGQSFIDLAHPDDIPRMFEVLQQQIVKREKQSGTEFRLRHRDGNYFWVAANNAAPIADETGNLIGFQGIVRNIHDRKLAEEQLRQINDQLLISNSELARATRLKDEFLANMSHELRTPLNVILGVSEALLDEAYGPLNGQYKKSLNLIDVSGRHLLELINDVLDVAKIESGKFELICAPTSLRYLFESSLIFVRPMAMQQNVTVRSSIAPGLDSLTVDERRLRQALINLLSNAIKFTPSGGEVEFVVAVNDATQELEFQVHDTGIGIAPEDISRLFQPFIQIDSSLSRQYSGTGLGLTLVKRIVNLHDGRVKVQSVENQGSCFTVCLPLARVAINADVPLVLPSCPPQNVDHNVVINVDHCDQPLQPLLPLVNHWVDQTAPLLLLAEDNPMNVEVVADYLHMHGYAVKVAENGLMALELAMRHRPDLILMDMQMPKMDGFTAMQKLRLQAEFKLTPIVALTALTMPGDADKCLAAGANTYLSKPIRLKELTGLIQHLLSSAPNIVPSVSDGVPPTPNGDRSGPHLLSPPSNLLLSPPMRHSPDFSAEARAIRPVYAGQ